MTDIPKSAPPVDVPARPNRALPPAACDAHIHMLGDDFPLWEGRVEDPADGSLEDWVALFTAHLDRLGLERAVIVHSILYGGDNSVTLAALRAMGDRARGIALVRDDVDDKTLDVLADQNVKGVRLNYVHGGILSWEGVKAMAPRLASRGMHVQMLMHTHLHMAELADDVRRLPVPVCFDHMGWPDLALGVKEPGFQTLCALVGDGQAYVKLSGSYRLCDAPYDRADEFMHALATANPEQCLWGSDWPHIMLADAKMPDAGVLLNGFLDVVTSVVDQHRILVDTPAGLYGF